MATRQEVVLGQLPGLRRRARADRRWATWTLYAGIAVVGVVGVAALFAPLIAPSTPTARPATATIRAVCPDSSRALSADSIGSGIST